MQQLLREINTEVDRAGGKLSPEESEKFRKRYRTIITEGEQECPAPTRPEGEKKRGRVKRSKARNLLERLKEFEADVLRFMDNVLVPFSNNQGPENDKSTPENRRMFSLF